MSRDRSKRPSSDEPSVIQRQVATPGRRSSVQRRYAGVRPRNPGAEQLVQRSVVDAIDAPAADSIQEDRATIQTEEGSSLSARQLSKAQRRNPHWARRLGFSASDFGSSARPRSAEFANDVARFQADNGLTTDGIAGPKTHRAASATSAGQLEDGVLGPADELEDGLLGPADELEDGLLGPADELEDGLLGTSADQLEPGLLGMDDPLFIGTSRGTLGADADTLEPGLLGGDNVQGQSLTETDTDAVHAAASHGIQGSTQPLPYRDEIEASTGQDLSGVKAVVGGKGAAASAAMGAQAYATGNHVVFAEQPDKHTAAHEAAHVIQQRGGVQLKGGVGAAGDQYEQQADAVADAVVRGEDAGLLGSSKRFSSSSGAVQRHETLEHKNLGDTGSGGLEYSWSAKGKEKVPFKLTHGDIIALSGDYFSPLDSDGNDALFVLAHKPSSKPGTQVGTQDEIMYALYWKDVGKERFQRGGAWEGVEFSKAVRDVVEGRYYKRAASNRDHFVAPEGVEQKSEDGDWQSSAGSAYRRHHEMALWIAYSEGKKGGEGNVNQALIREAAGQHYLTDSFASGHVRNPRVSMSDYWNQRHPGFFPALIKWMTAAIGTALKGQLKGPLAKVPDAAVLVAVNKKIKGTFEKLGEFHLGDMLGKVVHDVDNEKGLLVTNDLGQRWTAHGDGMLKKPDGADDKAIIHQAVALGIQDVRNACELGKLDKDVGRLEADRMLTKVRNATASPAKPDPEKYAPEQLMPRVDTQVDQSLTWEAASLAELWVKQLRADKSDSWGSETAKSFSEGGHLHSELQSASESLDEKMELRGGQMADIAKWAPGVPDGAFKGRAITIRPRQAFDEGFMTELESGVLAKLEQLAAGKLPK